MIHTSLGVCSIITSYWGDGGKISSLIIVVVIIENGPGDSDR